VGAVVESRGAGGCGGGGGGDAAEQADFGCVDLGVVALAEVEVAAPTLALTIDSGLEEFCNRLCESCSIRSYAAAAAKTVGRLVPR